MDIFKEWKLRPPTIPMDSLKAFVEDFVDRFPRERRDTVVTFCEAAPDLATAIRRAVASKNAEGKHHNHQSKIRGDVYPQFVAALLKVKRKMVTAKTFDELHDVISAQRFNGVGDLMVYDVATRIAAFLKLEPESVYLHAGVREGAKALGLDVKGRDRLLKEHLPGELRAIPADLAEDFLCTYRLAFASLKGGAA